MKWLYLIALVLLISPCSAYGTTGVNVTSDTTVVSSNFLDIYIWALILIVGIFFLVLSNLTSKETGAPIWALLSPFFLFSAAYFSSMLQRVEVIMCFNSNTGQYEILIENFIYHLDWIAVGLFGILFIFSFINMWYILTKKPLERTKRSDLYGDRTSSDTEE